METFTGLEYLKIDIANQYGMDKALWHERIAWTNENEGELEDRVSDADKPYLYLKAVNALRDTQNGLETGHVMGLDSTASGLQIMAVLIGCLETARNVNLIGSGRREDIYQKVRNEMNRVLPINAHVTRDQVKYPVMTTFYNSTAQPKEVFGEGTPELFTFYEVLSRELSGALEVMDDINQCWQSGAKVHEWTLPDGHVARVPVMVAVDKKIEVDELNHATFTHRMYVNEGTETGLSLPANVIQSIDGWIVREMIRRSHKQGFGMIAVHDDFFASPNHMNKVRKNFLDIMIELSKMDLLGSILRQITGTKHAYTKRSLDLHVHMSNAEYHLS